ncbi:acyl-CoA thioesterase [Brevundimonas nasdae]|uniref:Acyl-CoA thioesterase n=1 Tax=Brevundimonas nasdae TaxID=172043 RepID=A0ABX8TH17_9CAUL|nr:thioesterase family protein [Brevundimonas nasdae]QYC09105.1 acyl-CoA thioesterase [Brevundimonas nasdae]QYC15155.1 acyl-CoA thioesterase [Brevundimonas nasdae]
MARATLTPREDREVFVLPLEVLPEHIDANGHVNNVVYVGWLQDAGTAHWNARFSEEDRAKWSWVATRHEIDYLRGIEPGATGVVARTWVGEPHGPRFNRYVRIENAEGKVCAQGVTEWVLVDAATLRPQRIPPSMLTVFEATSAD